MSERSHFETLGGEARLRAIIDDFVERIFADTMIGFFFARANKARIKAKEYEFAARHLGLNIPYTGMPLPAAHAAHPIMGGHFMRRLQILKDTLASHQVPAEVADHWIAHTESMRDAITKQAGSECIDPVAAPNPTPDALARPGSVEVAGPHNMGEPSAPTKPVPSVAEIQAYLEASAARTKLRLPLVFARPEADPSATTAAAPSLPKAARPLPLASASSRTETDSGLQARTGALPIVKAAATEISSDRIDPDAKTRT